MNYINSLQAFFPDHSHPASREKAIAYSRSKLEYEIALETVLPGVWFFFFPHEAQ